MMTLLQWELKHDIRSYQSELGDDSIRYVYWDDCKIEQRAELYRLSNYKVSTVSSGVIWLWVIDKFSTK